MSNFSTAHNVSLIRLCLSDEAKIYDPFSVSAQNRTSDGEEKNSFARINPEILDYMKREVDTIPFGNKVSVVIDAPFATEEMFGFIKGLIGKSISKTIGDLTVKNRRTLRIASALAIIGILVFALASLVFPPQSGYVLHEVAIITSWVFIWRAVEMFFFKRGDTQLEMLKLQRLYFAEYKMAQPKLLSANIESDKLPAPMLARCND
jgi:hypothetical protein